jgi:hypothetical protein
MTATLWIGQTDDSEVNMLVPSGFIDDVIEILIVSLDAKHPEIINKLREGYAYSTYLNLADLEEGEFRIVSQPIFEFHARFLEDFVYERLPLISRYRLEIISLLKAGLIIDLRAVDDLNTAWVTLTLGAKNNLLARKWHFELLLELSISSQSEYLTRDEIQHIFSVWGSSSEINDMQLIQNVLTKSLNSLNQHYITSTTISLFFHEFLPSLETFLNTA